MIEIFCQTDLEKFKASNSYPPAFAEFLQTRFLELKQCMEKYFKEVGEFNLKEFGHMVVLEKSDNLRDLSEAGLNNFFNSVPEAVEEIVMPEFNVYQVSNIYNNDYMMIFYLPKGEFEAIYPELQDYLRQWQHQKIQFKPNGNIKPCKG